MVSLITDYIQETAASYLGAGIVAIGSLAGNAVGGIGSLIENSGRKVGDGVAGGIGGIGNYVNSYGDSIRGSMAPSQNARRLKGPKTSLGRASASSVVVPIKRQAATAASSRRPTANSLSTRSDQSLKVQPGKKRISAESRPSSVKKPPIPAIAARASTGRAVSTMMSNRRK